VINAARLPRTLSGYINVHDHDVVKILASLGWVCIEQAEPITSLNPQASAIAYVVLGLCRVSAKPKQQIWQVNALWARNC